MCCKAAHAFSSSGLSQAERLATQVTLVDDSGGTLLAVTSVLGKMGGLHPCCVYDGFCLF